jgi:hypothetical protein
MYKKITSLTGKKFGTVTILAQGSNDSTGHSTWVGKCDCGRTRTFSRSNIVNMNSCGRGCPYHTSRVAPLKVCKRGHEFTIENTYVDSRGSRTCRKCRSEAAYRSKQQNPERQERQREACRRWLKKKKQTNPNYHRDTYLQSTYGISQEQYDLMLEQQDGKCAICHYPPEDGSVLHIDHCHKSGKLRKLLCSYCNQALGLFRDDAERIAAAAEYIRSFEEQ